MALRVFSSFVQQFTQQMLKIACLSARDVENQISRPTIIQFDGVDVSRRRKCDCHHDYDFQYFFFTEISRGASRTFFSKGVYTKNTVQNRRTYKYIVKVLQQHALC